MPFTFIVATGSQRCLPSEGKLAFAVETIDFGEAAPGEVVCAPPRATRRTGRGRLHGELAAEPQRFWLVQQREPSELLYCFVSDPPFDASSSSKRQPELAALPRIPRQMPTPRLFDLPQ